MPATLRGPAPGKISGPAEKAFQPFSTVPDVTTAVNIVSQWPWRCSRLLVRIESRGCRFDFLAGRRRYNFEQDVYIRLRPLLTSCIIWYRQKSGNALRLGGNPQTHWESIAIIA